MTNIGKFVDRCPIICAAGKITKPNVSVREVLQEYQLADGIDALKNDFKVQKEKASHIPDKLAPTENIRHRGTKDRILNSLSPEVKTRYQEFITDLKETTYDSYWNKTLGKTCNPDPGLPKGMDIMNTTFGDKSMGDIPLYEVVFPNISRYQVLLNSQVNHDNYKRLFNDYNPGEKIDRNYYRPPYNPNNCAGVRNKYRVSGAGVACAMNWSDPDPLIRSKRQTDYLDKYGLKTGEANDPTGVRCCIPKGHTFGKLTERPMHGVADLLKPGFDPSIHKRETLERLASLNLLRQNIKKRFSPNFCVADLYNRFAEYDQGRTKFISMENFYDVISCVKINMNRENLESLFQDVGIIRAGKINYPKFIEALCFDLEFGKQLDPLPKERLYYCSEYCTANSDLKSFQNTDNVRAAGVTSYRYDLVIPPKRGCESERDNLLIDDVKALIDRSIFIQYDISYRDMFKQRSKAFIKSLFERCGYQFAEGSFDTLYSMAMCEDKTDGVCVDTFYKLIKKNLSPMIKIVDEIDCLSTRKS
ncbi:hypothetical protein WA026_008156 [Henosepilachna vigintioctopunctata]|uniref:EFHB C-terminal EF-hand domain-containing protein n=1 Tax=Henosepilachna vigintioctopunctata TaxID=420089 RepID=A0AAW1TQE9_9CUCU